MSQIQDKSWFFMTVFGDSKRIYDVERDFLKGQLIISKNKVIETGLASKKWNFLAILYSINNRRSSAYMVPMLQFFV